MKKAYYVKAYQNGAMCARWYRVNKCGANSFTFKNDKNTVHCFDDWQYKTKMIKGR